VLHGRRAPGVVRGGQGALLCPSWMPKIGLHATNVRATKADVSDVASP
jgi:hypothetical protein